MLDANAFILLLTGYDAVVQRALRCDEGEIGISAIALAEVALGSEQGKAPPSEVLEAAVREIPVLAFEADATWEYSKLPFRRGSYDRLIAAHAIASGLTLITSNVNDFKAVPGLKIENWAAA